MWHYAFITFFYATLIAEKDIETKSFLDCAKLLSALEEVLFSGYKSFMLMFLVASYFFMAFDVRLLLVLETKCTSYRCN